MPVLPIANRVKVIETAESVQSLSWSWSSHTSSLRFCFVSQLGWERMSESLKEVVLQYEQTPDESLVWDIKLEIEIVQQFIFTIFMHGGEVSSDVVKFQVNFIQRKCIYVKAGMFKTPKIKSRLYSWSYFRKTFSKSRPLNPITSYRAVRHLTLAG